jgi:hypothetical protein
MIPAAGLRSLLLELLAHTTVVMVVWHRVWMRWPLVTNATSPEAAQSTMLTLSLKAHPSRRTSSADRLRPLRCDGSLASGAWGVQRKNPSDPSLKQARV